MAEAITITLTRAQRDALLFACDDNVKAAGDGGGGWVAARR
jgi:hypothetical protein